MNILDTEKYNKMFFEAEYLFLPYFVVYEENHFIEIAWENGEYCNFDLFYFGEYVSTRIHSNSPTETFNASG